ncbi:SusC/RagA family TonB-linked outer membrane protein [Catalinimonas niigatensis]|uniref:SusC/RagA family TonB-linked outer membrane protein n=1 Tax=Catalinimonas niigatensis TaxID=1397264 RepID=UPI002666ADC4|nr:SusC/RagA family TonB-linked outer membrane protein [Catalinimonas niigatensis]WPP51979.1 SusC/RagA family TonB-linked outer membrane protein [Catalinimonas niigatensis]
MSNNLLSIGKYLLIILLCSMSLIPSLAQQPLASVSSVSHSNAQDDKAMSLGKVLEQIKTQYQVTFGYQEKLVAGKKVESELWKEQSLKQALETVLSPHGLEYKQLDDVHFVITLKDKDLPEKLLPKEVGSTGNSKQPDNALLLRKLTSQSVQVIKDLDKTLSGRVTDGESGDPLPGVNILAKGTTSGTVTDIEGNYRLTVSDEVNTLVFSSIGYLTEEVEINGRNTIDINLMPDIQSLSEVLVVGYGTVKKTDLTGSVVSVSTEGLENLPVGNAQEFLQGRAAGVQVQQRGGDLDGNFGILIRGVNSTGLNGPLYVVDGIPLAAELSSTINPNDIASLNILKDASATAIYGSRASNGVVVITTKTGRKGKSSINLEVKNGIETDVNRLDMMNTSEYLEFAEQAYSNSGREWPGISEDLAANDNDWQDLMLQTGKWREYNLTASGGSEKTTFLFSGSYLNRTGILIGTDLERYSFRVNLDHDLNSKLTMGVRLTNSFQNQEVAVNDVRFGNGYRLALFSRSWNPYKDEDGNFTGLQNLSPPNNGPQRNPVAETLEEIRQQDENRILGNVFAEYTFFEGLSFKVNLGVDLINGNNYTYLPKFDRGGYSRPVGDVTEFNSTDLNYLTDYTLTYNKTFGKHKVTGLLGSSIQKFNNQFFSVRANGTTNNALNQIGNQPNITDGTSSELNASILSYFGRLNYVFDDKYLLTATIRRDGSSRFGPGNKYGNFPSGSLAWRLSEERFMENVTLIDDLKLRASYGLTGNQAIADFQYLATTSPANYVFGDTEVSGIAPNSFANTDVQWETNKQLDLGVDLTLFSNRLSISADYYNKKSEDLLVVVPKPLTTGIPSDPTVNLGSIRNKGFDFSVTSYNFVSDFEWTTNLNFSTNKNEVLDIGQNALGEPTQIPGEAVAPFQGGIPINLTTAGQPIGAFYTLVFDGIWQENEAVQAEQFGVEPGDSKYVDQNGDGVINPDDRVFIGQANPKFYGGLTNTFSYKNFSVSTFINWQHGNQIFNQVRQFIEAGIPDVNVLDVDYWTPENQSNIYPRPLSDGRAFNYNTQPSTRLLEDGSFIRLKNVSLSYDFPKDIVDKIGFSIRMGFIATNLFTITQYSGLDPESASSDVLSGGFDSTPYPLSRTYLFSLNLGF